MNRNIFIIFDLKEAADWTQCWVYLTKSMIESMTNRNACVVFASQLEPSHIYSMPTNKWNEQYHHHTTPSIGPPHHRPPST
mmetsp:Transcript_23125/g.38097  ORF Transcript_23125/g.38097 Transcript_23125/m.38097 type:complete len:81 (+) Transcript_23125:151-393(+)